MKATKSPWLDLTEAARVSGKSPWTLRRLCNNSEGGVHMPKIPHRRDPRGIGKKTSDGRAGAIYIHSRTAKALRKLTS
jgi:hypothetical protein